MLEVGDRVIELQLNVFAVEPMVLRRGGEEVDGEEGPGEVECGKRRTAAREIWRWREGRRVVPATKEVPSGLRDRVGDFRVESMTSILSLILFPMACRSLIRGPGMIVVTRII